MARRGLIVLLAVLVVAPGCGGDDEPETSPPLPDLTVPQTDAAPPADTSDETDTTSEPPLTEVTPPPVEPETVPDSPTNDTPPPSDSPAERFEDFCNENPGSRGCG